MLSILLWKVLNVKAVFPSELKIGLLTKIEITAPHHHKNWFNTVFQKIKTCSDFTESFHGELCILMLRLHYLWKVLTN